MATLRIHHPRCESAGCTRRAQVQIRDMKCPYPGQSFDVPDFLCFSHYWEAQGVARQMGADIDFVTVPAEGVPLAEEPPVNHAECNASIAVLVIGTAAAGVLDELELAIGERRERLREQAEAVTVDFDLAAAGS